LQLEKLKQKIPSNIYSLLEKEIKELRPCQWKSIKKGLFDAANLLVCTPTASGKTKVGEMAALNMILNKDKKAVYVVPLKALATEKYKDFKEKYLGLIRTGISIGDIEGSDSRLYSYDLIICTSEKLDSLIRHKTSWLKEVGVVIVDEVHLLNDTSRGPTLEIVITTLRMLLKKLQLVCLSATIGNEKELANWLGAELIHDEWRPVELKKGIYLDGEVEFYD